MKKIYLHMGFHKTATTSFQATCKTNIKKLSKMDYLYPLFNSEYIRTKDIPNHSFALFSLFYSHPAIYDFNRNNNVSNVKLLNDQYRSYLKECLSKNMNVILSGEDVSSLPIESLYKMRDFFAEFDFEVVPIVVIRSPYEYHCSAYQQRIKVGRTSSPSEFISQIHKIMKVKTVFPDTLFIPFKESCKHELGPVGYLLESMGISGHKLKIINDNEGVSNINVRLQCEINNATPKMISGNFNDKWENKIFLGDDLNREKFYLTENEYLKIKDACDSENFVFQEIFGEEFKDKKITFSNLSKTCSELVDHFSSHPVDYRYVDYLRDLALKIEKNDVNLAYSLMKLARKVRPQGPLINKKIKEYERLIN